MPDKKLPLKPSTCPFCGSGCIEGGFIEIDGDIAFQNVTCDNCHEIWTEEYKLFARIQYEHHQNLKQDEKDARKK